MAKFYKNILKSEVAKQGRYALIETAYVEALSTFGIQKEVMLAEFDNHPVTKEIAAGPDVESNPSNTLGGKGNLFSFIGFYTSSDPIEPVREVLKENTTLLKTSAKVNYKKNLLTYSFPISMPTKGEIEKVSPLPWESGQSWVTGIEKGISGLGHYIFKRYFNKSRSTTGLQTKKEVRSASFKTVDYLTKIKLNFLSKFR